MYGQNDRKTDNPGVQLLVQKSVWTSYYHVLYYLRRCSFGEEYFLRICNKSANLNRLKCNKTAIWHVIRKYEPPYSKSTFPWKLFICCSYRTDAHIKNGSQKWKSIINQRVGFTSLVGCWEKLTLNMVAHTSLFLQRVHQARRLVHNHR